MNKAKQLLLNEIRKLKTKIEMKNREVIRFELEVAELQIEVDKL